MVAKPKPRPIAQAQLARIAAQFAQTKSLQIELEAAQERLLKLVEPTVRAIETGTPIEQGEHCAKLVLRSSCRPSWKDAFARALGPAAIERVIKETAPSTYVRLIVNGVDVGGVRD